MHTKSRQRRVFFASLLVPGQPRGLLFPVIGRPSAIPTRSSAKSGCASYRRGDSLPARWEGVRARLGGDALNPEHPLGTGLKRHTWTPCNRTQTYSTPLQKTHGTPEPRVVEENGRNHRFSSQVSCKYAAGATIPVPMGVFGEERDSVRGVDVLQQEQRGFSLKGTRTTRAKFTEPTCSR